MNRKTLYSKKITFDDIITQSLCFVIEFQQLKDVFYQMKMVINPILNLKA